MQRRGKKQGTLESLLQKGEFMRFVLLFLLCWGAALQANDLVIVNRPYSATDKRNDYAYALLLQALQKSIPQYGPYELRLASLELPRGSVANSPKFANSNDRLLYEIKRGELVNVAMVVTRDEWEREALPIRIPIDRGLMSYRIFLIRKSEQAQFSAIHELAQLKALRSGAGEAWSNYRVLQHHQFTLVPTNQYESQFRMLLAQRFDYIARGAHEAFSEIDTYGPHFPEMAIERDLLLYMPLPLYFFVSPKQPRLAERIEAGLRLMLRDGSFLRLFQLHQGPIIEQARLCERRVFHVENPFLSKETPLDQHELWFDPWRAAPGKKALCARSKSNVQLTGKKKPRPAV